MLPVRWLQADGMGADIGGTLPGANLAAQFSLTWLDVAPAAITDAQAHAYKLALMAKLPKGAPGGHCMWL